MVYMTNAIEPASARSMCTRHRCTGEAYEQKCDSAMTHRENEEVLDIREAAERMGVSIDTIRRRLRAGELPRAARGTGSNAPWRIPLGDLIAAGLTQAGLEQELGLPFSPSDATSVEGHLAVLREVIAILQRQVWLLEAEISGGRHAAQH